MHEKNNKYVNSLHIPASFWLFFSVLSIIQIFELLIVISLSLVFESVYLSNFYIGTIAFGFIFHLIDSFKSVVSVKTQDGKRYEKLDDIMWIYIESQGVQDILLLAAYILEFAFYNTLITEITRYIFILKVIPLLKRLDFF